MINVLGKGFIGQEFVGDDVVYNGRDEYVPKSNKILYFISTVDNYNVWDQPHLDIDTNLNVLVSVLENARLKYQSDFEFNFVSSWFVYGKDSVPPVKESDYCNPTGFYSITKRCAEQLLGSYCETYRIKYRILRLPGVIGVSDKKVSKKKNALQYMIRLLVNNEKVSLYEGSLYRDLMDVRDVVRAIRLVIENGNLNEIYNIGNGYGYSVSEIIKSIHSYLGIGEVEVIPVPEFHKTVQASDFWMDTTKLRGLGFVPEHDVLESCKEIADFYRNGL